MVFELVYFYFNTLFWEHTSFDGYSLEFSFSIYIFAVVCSFFQIALTRYALQKLACFVNKQFLDICPSIFNNKVSNKKSRLGCTVLNQAIDIWDVYKCSHRGNFFCRKINFNKCSFKNFIKKKNQGHSLLFVYEYFSWTKTPVPLWAHFISSK